MAARGLANFLACRITREWKMLGEGKISAGMRLSDTLRRYKGMGRDGGKMEHKVNLFL